MIPVAREGLPFIGIGAALTIVFFLLALPWAAVLLLGVTLFVTWFFRDPERNLPEGDSLLLSPADGKVIEVLPLPGGGTKVGIFLSIFNVHVNRVPASGNVSEVTYRRGKFLAAWNVLASEENEQAGIVIDHPRGAIRVVQVAGLIARRIICRLEEGQQVRRGERYGLIRFGSRVDTYLPQAAEAAVRTGDRVKGGESVVARWKN